MRYQSTGEVRPPRPGELALLHPPPEDEERVAVRWIHGTDVPRVIMEPVPTLEQLRDRAIEALMDWRRADWPVEHGAHSPQWTPHVEALERLRKAADAYLEGLVNA